MYKKLSFKPTIKTNLRFQLVAKHRGAVQGTDVFRGRVLVQDSFFEHIPSSPTTSSQVPTHLGPDVVAAYLDATSTMNNTPKFRLHYRSNNILLKSRGIHLIYVTQYHTVRII